MPDQVLIDRMLGRGRKDDNEETITRRLEVYREQTAPVINYYHERNILKPVNGNLTQEEVSTSLKKVLGN